MKAMHKILKAKTFLMRHDTTRPPILPFYMYMWRPHLRHHISLIAFSFWHEPQTAAGTGASSGPGVAAVAVSNLPPKLESSIMRYR